VDAYIQSGINSKKQPLLLNTYDHGLIPLNAANPIPPNTENVTLIAEFPSLSERDFMNDWGVISFVIKDDEQTFSGKIEEKQLREIFDGYRPKTPPPRATKSEPDGDITKLSNSELLSYTVNFATDMRTFEANSDIARTKAVDLIPQNSTQERRLEIYQKNSARSQELSARYREQFQNLYLHPANQLRAELKSRLNKSGKIAADTFEMHIGGQNTPIELPAFEGHLVGPNPISNAANYLEQLARRLQ
jgi:hypothetical protein